MLPAGITIPLTAISRESAAFVLHVRFLGSPTADLTWWHRAYAALDAVIRLQALGKAFHDTDRLVVVSRAPAVPLPQRLEAVLRCVKGLQAAAQQLQFADGTCLQLQTGLAFGEVADALLSCPTFSHQWVGQPFIAAEALAEQSLPGQVLVATSCMPHFDARAYRLESQPAVHVTARIQEPCFLLMEASPGEHAEEQLVQQGRAQAGMQAMPLSSAHHALAAQPLPSLHTDAARLNAAFPSWQPLYSQPSEGLAAESRPARRVHSVLVDHARNEPAGLIPGLYNVDGPTAAQIQRFLASLGFSASSGIVPRTLVAGADVAELPELGLASRSALGDASLPRQSSGSGDSDAGVQAVLDSAAASLSGGLALEASPASQQPSAGTAAESTAPLAAHNRAAIHASEQLRDAAVPAVAALVDGRDETAGEASSSTTDGVLRIRGGTPPAGSGAQAEISRIESGPEQPCSCEPAGADHMTSDGAAWPAMVQGQQLHLPTASSACATDDLALLRSNTGHQGPAPTIADGDHSLPAAAPSALELASSGDSIGPLDFQQDRWMRFVDAAVEQRFRLWFAQQKHAHDTAVIAISVLMGLLRAQRAMSQSDASVDLSVAYMRLCIMIAVHAAVCVSILAFRRACPTWFVRHRGKFVMLMRFSRTAFVVVSSLVDKSDPACWAWLAYQIFIRENVGFCFMINIMESGLLLPHVAGSLVVLAAQIGCIPWACVNQAATSACWIRSVVLLVLLGTIVPLLYTAKMEQRMRRSFVELQEGRLLRNRQKHKRE